MPMNIKEEIAKINAELEMLTNERKQAEALRDAKLKLLQAKLANLPVGFTQNHPILSSIASRFAPANIPTTVQEVRQGAGQVAEAVKEAVEPLRPAYNFLKENQMRAQSNAQFAQNLKEGETGSNPVTGQSITKDSTREKGYVAQGGGRKLIKV